MPGLRPRYQIGLIPCTSGKKAGGRTPLTLYKGPGFSTMMKHAQQRCDVIMIMSARYGLLGLNDPVSYYDAYLPDLDDDARSALMERVRCAVLPGWDCRSPILSYLPKAYHEFLVQAKPALTRKLRRPYSNLGMLHLPTVLSNEVKGYGTNPARR